MLISLYTTARIGKVFVGVLENISVILVNPSHPGNIGATARAMKVMGINRLVLVNPKVFPNPLADAMASGAQDVLQTARVCDSLSKAIEKASLVIGTTARTRDVMIEPVMPEVAAQKVKSASLTCQVALVFGAERTGLTNEELRLCNGLVSIPTSKEYHSLNLAQAVQVLCYECFRACTEKELSLSLMDKTDDRKATRDEVEGLLAHFERAMVSVDFYNQNSPKRLMNRLWRLFNRAELEEKEVNILRGFLKLVERNSESLSRVDNKGEMDD